MTALGLEGQLSGIYNEIHSLTVITLTPSAMPRYSDTDPPRIPIVADNNESNVPDRDRDQLESTRSLPLTTIRQVVRPGKIPRLFRGVPLALRMGCEPAQGPRYS